MSSSIIEGAATVLWGLAWADHVEEAACRSLAGCKIEDEMPSIPDEAYHLAWRMIGKYEQASGMDMHALYAAAMRAEGVTYSEDTREAFYQLPARFGECLAFMALGTGVSWFDDHNEFPLPRVYVENCDLMILAQDTCEDCDNDKCSICRKQEHDTCGNDLACSCCRQSREG